MSRFFSDELNTLSPYTPGEQPQDKKYLKLNTNESPFKPSSEVIKALNTSQVELLRLYPDPECTLLRKTAAKRFSLSEENVTAGNGSDENLAFAIRAFCSKDKPLVFPDITYGFYSVWAKLFGIPAKQILLTDDFKINIEEYFNLNCTIVIANPNAPTGISLSVDDIEKIVVNNPDGVVIIDEAYVDFGAESCVPLINKYDNLLVVQTFSKSRSLAGARLGLAFGSKELISDINRVRYSFNPYNINRLTLLAGQAALDDEEYFSYCTQEICKAREWTAEELKKLGFSLTQSKTNFLFAKHGEKHSRDIYRLLREKGVLVRRWDAPRIENYLRITVGTTEDMKKFIEILKSCLEEL